MALIVILEGFKWKVMNRTSLVSILLCMSMISCHTKQSLKDEVSQKYTSKFIHGYLLDTDYEINGRNLLEEVKWMDYISYGELEMCAYERGCGTEYDSIKKDVLIKDTIHYYDLYNIIEVIKGETHILFEVIHIAKNEKGFCGPKEIGEGNNNYDPQCIYSYNIDKNIWDYSTSNTYQLWSFCPNGPYSYLKRSINYLIDEQKEELLKDYHSPLSLNATEDEIDQYIELDIKKNIEWLSKRFQETEVRLAKQIDLLDKEEYFEFYELREKYLGKIKFVVPSDQKI